MMSPGRIVGQRVGPATKGLVAAMLFTVFISLVACSGEQELPAGVSSPPEPGTTVASSTSVASAKELWDEEFWRQVTVEELGATLDEGLDIQSKDESGDSLLHYAAEFNSNPRLITLLLDRGAEIDALGWSMTPLHLAALKNVAPVVALLLDRGADLMARASDSGYTPLHYAAENEDVEVLSLLLERGADATVANGSGTTPLHIATQHPGREFAVALLLEAGADPTARNRLRAACLGLTSDGSTVQLTEYLPGLCAATPVPKSSSLSSGTASRQSSVCSRDVGSALRTDDAEDLHEYVSDRQGPGPVDGSLTDRWLCIPGGVVREIAPIYVLNRARGVDLSMETVLVPGGQGTHAVRVTTYNPEKTDRVMRTTGILCITENVKTLEIGEKITVSGKYSKAHSYLDMADENSDIQTQIVRFCEWERKFVP